MKRAPPRKHWTASTYSAPAARRHPVPRPHVADAAPTSGTWSRLCPRSCLRQRKIRRSRQDTAHRMSPGSFTVLRLRDVDPQPPQLRLLDIPAAAGFFVGLEVVAVPVSSLVR